MKKLLLLLTLAVFGVSGAFANSVSFYFQDGEEDDFEIMYPSAYVSIWNSTAEEMVNVPSQSAYMPFEFTSATMLRISPDDFDYELVVKVDGDESMYMLDKEDTEWYLTLFEDADDLEIYVQVYLAGQAPGGDSKNVSVNFNISAAEESGISNPGEQVTISYFDRSTFQDVTLTVVEDSANATVVPGTSFSITPSDGYVISEIMTWIEGIVSISEPGEGSTEWNVSVSETPASDFSALFITVDKAPSADPNAATITQIEALQWKVEWPGYTSINKTDSDYNGTNVILTDSAGKTTTLYSDVHGTENPSIIFPDYGNFFTINLTKLNLANGDYQLTIPAGFVELGTGRVPSPAQYFEITVGGSGPSLTHNPVFSDLQVNYIDITWENVTTLAEGTTKGAYMRNVMTNKNYDLYFLENDNYSTANVRIFDNHVLRVNITNNYPTLPAGMYELYIPADYVLFNGTTEGNVAIEGHMFTYTPAWSEGNIVMDGPTSDNIITLTWEDATAIQYNTDYKGDGQKITGVTIFDSKDQQITLDYPGEISIDANVMTIDLNGVPVADGECILLIPEDILMVTVDDVTDYTFGNSFRFTFGDGGNDNPDVPQYNGEATWSVKSGDTVTGGTLIEVGWNNYTLEFIPDAEQFSIHNPATGVIDLDYGTEVTLSEDKTRILIDINSYPSYAYRVNVPEACVYLDINGKKYFNTGTSMDNVIVSVESIEAENGHFRVINLQGIVVMDTDSCNDLKNLPAGIYIVNGKKVRL